jgi:hypothetical protein
MLDVPMRDYAILNSRKRTIIALVHTVVFLGIALFLTDMPVSALQATSPAGAWILAGVYLIVSAILWVLAARSGNSTERLYFGLCATSAGFGLLRQWVGDPGMHAAVYIRVAMLGGAVWTALLILRAHNEPAAEASSAVAN